LVLALPLDGEEQRKKRAVLGRLDFRGDASQQVLLTAFAKLCDPVGAVAALRAQLLAPAKG
jgi:hypothetical protein